MTKDPHTHITGKSRNKSFDLFDPAFLFTKLV